MSVLDYWNSFLTGFLSFHYIAFTLILNCSAYYTVLGHEIPLLKDLGWFFKKQRTLTHSDLHKLTLCQLSKLSLKIYFQSQTFSSRETAQAPYLFSHLIVCVCVCVCYTPPPKLGAGNSTNPFARCQWTRQNPVLRVGLRSFSSQSVQDLLAVLHRMTLVPLFVCLLVTPFSLSICIFITSPIRPWLLGRTYAIMTRRLMFIKYLPCIYYISCLLWCIYGEVSPCVASHSIVTSSYSPFCDQKHL